ncbi:MAG TPA: AAA family ATPase [Actinomycetota bacterium]
MSTRRPEVSLYHRNAGQVTSRRVLHPMEKAEEIAALPRMKRKRSRAQLEERWQREEAEAAASTDRALEKLAGATDSLRARLAALTALNVPEFRGKVESEVQRVDRARAQLASAREALHARDFGAAGASSAEAGRELWLLGGSLVIALNQALSKAAIGREQRGLLRDNLRSRQAAKTDLESLRRRGAPPEDVIEAAARVHALEAEGFDLAAAILRSQTQPVAVVRGSRGERERGLDVIPPAQLETFDDVGGLDEVKDQLRASVGAILDRPDEAARYRVVHNGILFYGPPGTGKTLLSRALAGEYGLRYLRFSPASIASAYMHEAASNHRKLFELARDNTPIVLFLDEVDAIASTRDDQPSADHREIVTQLMNCLEDYRAIPGLVITAATNSIDRLDAGLREGRFDARILVPLPDAAARTEILRVHLQRRADAVVWDGIDLDEIARMTRDRNAAALEGFVTTAAQSALGAGRPIVHADLVEAVKSREGKDRVSLEDPVTWDDVVIPDETRERLLEITNVLVRPDLARALGVGVPAGVLLYGPPGTGKTTIAKAMATEIEASFYEQSAADLLSKWAGESEERVAKLFARARANRPAIVFVDEIDGLLRTRGSEGSSGWEERVVSQFLRELDGIHHGEGVLLVGATNRIDIIDPAVRDRRLTAIEVGLPDAAARLGMLQVLCRNVSLAPDVDLRSLAGKTEGMSGADLKRLRDAAGMKALTRAARGPGAEPAMITMADLSVALEELRVRATLVQA